MQHQSAGREPDNYWRVSSGNIAGRAIRAASEGVQDRPLVRGASLAALFDNRIEVIAVSNIVGHILPPGTSSLGKVITAFQTEGRREKLLRSYGTYRFIEHSITDRTELDLEFARGREQRFATDLEESVCDGHCFGVSIFGSAGNVCATFTVIPFRTNHLNPGTSFLLGSLGKSEP